MIKICSKKLDKYPEKRMQQSSILIKLPHYSLQSATRVNTPLQIQLRYQCFLPNVRVSFLFFQSFLPSFFKSFFPDILEFPSFLQSFLPHFFKVYSLFFSKFSSCVFFQCFLKVSFQSFFPSFIPEFPSSFSQRLLPLLFQSFLLFFSEVPSSFQIRRKHNLT